MTPQNGFVGLQKSSQNDALQVQDFVTAAKFKKKSQIKQILFTLLPGD